MAGKASRENLIRYPEVTSVERARAEQVAILAVARPPLSLITAMVVTRAGKERIANVDIIRIVRQFPEKTFDQAISGVSQFYQVPRNERRGVHPELAGNAHEHPLGQQALGYLERLQKIVFPTASETSDVSGRKTLEIEDQTAKLIYAVSGHLVAFDELLAIEYPHGNVFIDDFIGKDPERSDSRNAILNRANIVRILVAGYKRYGENFSIRQVEIEELLGSKIKGLQHDFAALRSKGLISFSTEGYRVLPEFGTDNPQRRLIKRQQQLLDIFTQMPQLGIHPDESGYYTIEQFKQAAEKMGISNLLGKDSQVLKRIKRAPFLEKREGITLTQQQYRVLFAYNEIIEGLMHPTDAFLAKGRTLADQFLDSQNSLKRILFFDRAMQSAHILERTKIQLRKINRRNSAIALARRNLNLRVQAVDDEERLLITSLEERLSRKQKVTAEEISAFFDRVEPWVQAGRIQKFSSTNPKWLLIKERLKESREFTHIAEDRLVHKSTAMRYFREAFDSLIESARNSLSPKEYADFRKLMLPILILPKSRSGKSRERFSALVKGRPRLRRGEPQNIRSIKKAVNWETAKSFFALIDEIRTHAPADLITAGFNDSTIQMLRDFWLGALSAKAIGEKYFGFASRANVTEEVQKYMPYLLAIVRNYLPEGEKDQFNSLLASRKTYATIRELKETDPQQRAKKLQEALLEAREDAQRFWGRIQNSELYPRLKEEDKRIIESYVQGKVVLPPEIQQRIANYVFDIYQYGKRAKLIDE